MVVLSVSEIKENKAGKVTAGYKLVLLNLPQKAVHWRSRVGNRRGTRAKCSETSQKDSADQGVAGGPSGILLRLLCFVTV